MQKKDGFAEHKLKEKEIMVPFLTVRKKASSTPIDC
jgi:hypothetical protein